MDHKRPAEGSSSLEAPSKQPRMAPVPAEPPADYPEPTSLDMVDDGRVAVFQRAQLWAKVADLNAHIGDLTARNAQLEEHVASLNHVPRAALYHLTAVQEDLTLTISRSGIKLPANTEKSPVSAAILDPEANVSDLLDTIDAPLKPIRELLAKIVFALERHCARPDAEQQEKTMADLHSRIRATSDRIERFSAREAQFCRSLTTTQLDLEDARQNLETLRKHIVSLELAASQRSGSRAEESSNAKKAASANRADGDATASQNKGDKSVLVSSSTNSKHIPAAINHQDSMEDNKSSIEMAGEKAKAEIERLRKLAESRLEEIKDHMEEKKQLRVERERLREEAEIREGGVVEMKEILGSALYQTMEMTLQQLCLKEQVWEREREQKDEAWQNERKIHEQDLRETRETYEDRLKAMKKEVEEMRAEKDKAKAEKDKWIMQYEARKIDHGKGRIVAASESRARLAEKMRDRLERENERLKQRVCELERRIRSAEDLVSSRTKAEKDETVKRLQTALEEEREKSDGFIGEIESTLKLLSDVEAENGRLAKLLSEKEQTLSKVMGERLRNKQALTTVKEENKTMLAKLAVEADKLKALNALFAASRKEAMEAKVVAQKSEEEARLLALQAEKRRRIADELTVTTRTAVAEKEELKRQLDSISSQGQAAVAEVEDSQYKLKRAKEELQAATKELESLKKERENKLGHSEEDAIRDELISELTRKLNCSVVTSQPKQVVLLRCGHLFSRQCVDELVAGRNRKCPICGERFGQDDVRPVFFT